MYRKGCAVVAPKSGAISRLSHCKGRSLPLCSAELLIDPAKLHPVTQDRLSDSARSLTPVPLNHIIFCRAGSRARRDRAKRHDSLAALVQTGFTICALRSCIATKQGRVQEVDFSDLIVLAPSICEVGRAPGSGPCNSQHL